VLIVLRKGLLHVLGGVLMITPLIQCIEEQEYSSPEERERVLAEVRAWLEENPRETQPTDLP
jgi:hypothetical protein